MKKLEAGKLYNNKDIADWFGIDPATFSRKKEQKLKQLKLFATFELVGNKTKKIKIIKVYNDTYSKQGSNAYQEVKSRIDTTWSPSGLDSCSRVGLAIDKQLQNEMVDLQYSTIYRYTLNGSRELYGKPFENGGTLGRCIYIWCKKQGEGDQAKYYPLTEEEQKIKKRLLTKYFGDTTEQQVLVSGLYKAGEITKEEAWDMLEDMTNMKDMRNYGMFLKELGQMLHCKIVRATKVIKDNEIEGVNWEER